MSTLSFTRDQRGMALLNLVLLFIFLGVLVASGVKTYGSIVARGKINDTKGSLENEVRMITAWAVKNGRLPMAAEYPGVFGGTNPPVDAWGKSIFYIYDASLAGISTGGLCGRTMTNLSNNAFALVSGGDDYTILSTADATVITASKAATAFAPDKSDLYRVVTLEELKSKAGCYGATGGRLRIVNNELPSACTNIVYPATIFADGGNPSPIYSYSISGLPAGLASTGAIISGTPTIVGVKAVSVTVTDNQTPTPNIVQRTYNLKVIACGICANYTVNNTTTNGHDVAISGVCQGKNTITFPMSLAPGQSISLYTSNSGKCGGNLLGTYKYSDLLAAGGNNSCTVDFGGSGGGGDDNNGYDDKGYDDKGYDHDGYDHNGYDHNGDDHDGYDNKGYDKNGYDKNGHDNNWHNNE